MPFFKPGNLGLKVMDTILACSSLDVSFDKKLKYYFPQEKGICQFDSAL